jgi:hypothetical protein
MYNSIDMIIWKVLNNGNEKQPVVGWGWLRGKGFPANGKHEGIFEDLENFCLEFGNGSTSAKDIDFTLWK